MTISDESKFGKRKYNKGRRVKGNWVFGGVERGDKTKIFMFRVEKRDEATLIPLIQKFIKPGTTIHSDCWKAYSKLEKLGYVHETVNHKEAYIDPDTGAHTNSIEGSLRLA